MNSAYGEGYYREKARRQELEQALEALLIAVENLQTAGSIAMRHEMIKDLDDQHDRAFRVLGKIENKPVYLSQNKNNEPEQQPSNSDL